MLQRIEACPTCRGLYTGYLLYILQAATQAIKEGDLWLCYGSAVEEAPPSQGHEAELRRLGQKIVDCCKDAGLTVDWTGDAEDMIVIQLMHHVKVVSIHDDAISIAVAILATSVDRANPDRFGYVPVWDICLLVYAGIISE
ncbi:TPA: hypothetical protein ACH3X1_000267 [Trebouxia sp. C0004]